MLMLTLVVAGILAACTYCLYNVFFHALRSYPGPLLWSCTRIPWMWHNLKGDLAQRILALHESYGQVVRIGPDELSYTTASAWNSIYGDPEMTKALDGRGLAPPHYDGAHSILQAPTVEAHARLRRLIAPAFTASAIRDEEPHIIPQVEDLIKAVQYRGRSAPVDLTRLMVEAVFDVLGELGFGSSFDALKGNSEAHEIVSSGLGAAKAIVFLRLIFFYRLDRLMKLFLPSSVARARARFIQKTTERLEARLAAPASVRRDFFTFVLNKPGNHGDRLTLQELVLMAVVFVGAGTLTIAYATVATIYLLQRSPDIRRRLLNELEAAVTRADEIDLATVSKLPFLGAVVRETLRFYPPVPGTLPRVVPRGGKAINGAWVPAGMVVGVHSLSAARSAANFHDPDSYMPERWLDPRPGEFKNDIRAASQPYSVGPRDCVGKTLADAELRLFIARLIYEFEFELSNPSVDWLQGQRSLLAWDAPPLMVNARRRVCVPG